VSSWMPILASSVREHVPSRTSIHLGGFHNNVHTTITVNTLFSRAREHVPSGDKCLSEGNFLAQTRLSERGCHTTATPPEYKWRLVSEVVHKHVTPLLKCHFARGVLFEALRPDQMAPLSEVESMVSKWGGTSSWRTP
jgi:hypothetical protein